MSALGDFFKGGDVRVERYGQGSAGLCRALLRAFLVGALAVGAVGASAYGIEEVKAPAAAGSEVAVSLASSAEAKRAAEAMRKYFNVAVNERAARGAMGYDLSRETADRYAPVSAISGLSINFKQAQLQALLGRPATPVARATCSLNVSMANISQNVLDGWFMTTQVGLEFVARHEEDHCQTNAVINKAAARLAVASLIVAEGEQVLQGSEGVGRVLDAAMMGADRALASDTAQEAMSVYLESRADAVSILKMAASHSGYIDVSGAVNVERATAFGTKVREYAGRVREGRASNGEFFRPSGPDLDSHDSEGALRLLEKFGADEAGAKLSALDLENISDLLGRQSVAWHYEKKAHANENAVLQMPAEQVAGIQKAFHEGSRAICARVAPTLSESAAKMPFALQAFEPVQTLDGKPGEWVASPCGSGRVVVTNGFDEHIVTEGEFMKAFAVPRWTELAKANLAPAAPALVRSTPARERDSLTPGM